jgi:hypothetical protein
MLEGAAIYEFSSTVRIPHKAKAKSIIKRLPSDEAYKVPAQ